jgi:WD40 repeat protein
MSVHAPTSTAEQVADMHLADLAKMHLANSGGSVEILDLAADGPLLLAGLSDGKVHVYSAATRSLLYRDSASAAGSPVTAVANSNQRKSFFAVAANGVRVIRDGSVDYTTMCGSFAPACFFDALWACSPSIACTVPQLMGQNHFTEYLRSYVLLHRYADPTGSDVYCAAVSPDGKLLAVGGEGRLLLFDAKTKQLAAVFEDTHKEAVSQVGSCQEHCGMLDVLLDIFATLACCCIIETHTSAVILT